jgi:anti-anti-sigma factor
MNNNDIVSGFDSDTDEKLFIALEMLEGVDDGLLVGLSGYIDTYNSMHIQQRMQKAFDAGFTRVLFDMRALAYASSTGIYSFICFRDACQRAGGDMALAGMQDVVAGVFDILGFMSFFPIFDSVEDARHFLMRGRVAEAS